MTVFILSPSSLVATTENYQVYNLRSLPSNNLLTQIPKHKGTVGIVPLYHYQNQVYILLGKETSDGTKNEKSGKFSDFGGSILLNGTTILANLIREFKEETMGQIALSPDDLLARGLLFYKKTLQGRNIFYVCYPFSLNEFDQSKQLNPFRTKAKLKNDVNSEHEKDLFLWIKLKTLVDHISADLDDSRIIAVTDIDNKPHHIRLRQYFIDDFLKHPDFSKIVTLVYKQNLNHHK